MDLNNTGSSSPMKQTATGTVSSPGQVALKGKAGEKADKPAAAEGETAVLFGDTTKHEGPKFPPPHMVSVSTLIAVFDTAVWLWFGQ